MSGTPRTALILPGIGDSGPGHWQTLWQEADPRIQKVQQADWDAPVMEEWLDELQRHLDRTGDDVVLVAHSLGCLLVAHWAQRTGRKVAGALLVAVPDTSLPVFPAAARHFAPVPLQPLGFPSIIACSEDDPHATVAFTRDCAAAWGSDLRLIGNRGHINVASRIGAWEDGRAMLRELGA